LYIVRTENCATKVDKMHSYLSPAFSELWICKYGSVGKALARMIMLAFVCYNTYWLEWGNGLTLKLWTS
jgi:hypothetical protein